MLCSSHRQSDIWVKEATVTLFPLPSFAPPTPLVKAKAAFSFSIHSSVHNVQPPANPNSAAEPEFTRTQPIPTLTTQLLVGCRRKVVIYSWKDGEPQDVKVRRVTCYSCTTLNQDCRRLLCRIPRGQSYFWIKTQHVSRIRQPNTPYFLYQA